MKLVKKPKSPFWWMDFTVNGKRFRLSTKRPLHDKEGAKRVLALAYRTEIDKTQFKTKPEITLSAALEITLSETEGQTHRVYKSAGAALCEVLGGQVNLSALTTEQLHKYALRRRKMGMRSNTIRSDFKVLNRVINRVKATHLVNRDLEPPTIKKFVKTRYLTDAEEAEVLAVLRSKPDLITAQKAEALFLFLIDTGFRLMEAVEIDWHGIDMINRRIEVFRTKTKTVSTVPMSGRVYDLLKRRSNAQRPFGSMEFAVKYLRKVISEVCNKDQRQVETRGKATIHSLRDTYATRMRKRGMDMGQIASLLGHSTMAMAEKYAHIEPQDVVEQARSYING